MTSQQRLQTGLAPGLIQFDAKQKNINYRSCNKNYRYSEPEEKVRAQVYLKLILHYGYAPERIDLELAWFNTNYRMRNTLKTLSRLPKGC